MPPVAKPPLSIAQVLALAAGTWVNDGFVAVIRSLKPSPATAARKFWKCVLGDCHGHGIIGMTVFFPPKFGEGDVIEATGAGIKRSEFKGEPDLKLGKNSVIALRDHVPQPLQRQLPPTLPAGGRPPAGAAPQANGRTPPVDVETATLSMTIGWDLVSRGLTGDQLRDQALTRHFWSAYHTAASDVARVELQIRLGKLAPSVRARATA